MIQRLKDITVHFIGIGGIGMSGIAEVLLSHGLSVSGSDQSASATTEKLESLGAKVWIGHRASNLQDVTIVVHSSAVSADNPEMVEARRTNRPIMKRAEMLAELMKLKLGIAIAGTHGKTTTTSMLATILKECNMDPTYIIGGVVKNLNGHARLGLGDYLVAEADESDGSFLLLNPILSVITNIDNDHLDFYKSEEQLEEAFISFANKVPFYGTIAINGMDERIQKIIPKLKKPFITFGISDVENTYEYSARKIKNSTEGSEFDLVVGSKNTGRVKINLPGEHNILNALGAISIASEMGLPISDIIKALEKFEGVGRRFQVVYKKNDCTIVDDYGHHPTEIAETIRTAISLKEKRRLTIIFEPHRYTRTRDCWDQFLHCFNGADEVILAPVYPASEAEINGINSLTLKDSINRLHPGLVRTIDSISTLKNTLRPLCSESSLVICMGAGGIGRALKEAVEGL